MAHLRTGQAAVPDGHHRPRSDHTGNIAGRNRNGHFYHDSGQVSPVPARQIGAQIAPFCTAFAIVLHELLPAPNGGSRV